MDNQKEPLAAKQTIPTTMITDKLLEFQKRVSAISKDSVNPFFKSKYFDVNTVIDTIKPILNEVGLVVTQPFKTTTTGDNVLVTEIRDNGNILLTSEVFLPEILDIQKFGAAITYFRRYALVSLLLLQGEEDDDGNKAVKPNPAPRSVPTTQPAPTTNKADAKALTGNSMTTKQNAMIHALMKEKGLTSLKEAGIEKIEHPTLSDASSIIKKLMDYKPEEKVIQLDEIQFDKPYVEGHEND